MTFVWAVWKLWRGAVVERNALREENADLRDELVRARRALSFYEMDGAA